MKKFCTIFLIFLINFITITPCLSAESFDYIQKEKEKPFITEIEDERVYLDPKSVYKLEFESDLDLNETYMNDEIYFRLISPVKASNGMYLPDNTRFAGKFKKINKSKPLFKRARAYIIIDKILLPNEKSYTLRMEPKKGSDLKAPQILNTIRAIPASVGIVTFSVLSVAVVAIESVTLVGLIVVPRTCNGFGLLISSMAKGLNYKAKAGSTIEFKLDTPVYVNVSDLKY